MKKLSRLLALTLVLLLLTTLVSCGAPKKDVNKALSSLKSKGYVAVHDTLILPGLFKLDGYELNSAVSASKETTDKNGNKTKEFVGIYYFADKQSAKEAMAAIEYYAGEDKADTSSTDKNWIAPKRAGNIIYYGTKAAVKAAR